MRRGWRAGEVGRRLGVGWGGVVGGAAHGLQQLRLSGNKVDRAQRVLECRLAKRARVCEEDVATAVHEHRGGAVERFALVLAHQRVQPAVVVPAQQRAVRQVAHVRASLIVKAHTAR